MELAKSANAVIRTAIAALLLVLLYNSGSHAQEAPEAQEPASQEPADKQAAEEVPPEPAKSSDEDPFDYEATEQISEDLSVSFPVDI